MIGPLERPLPKIARMLEEAEDDVLAFYAFPLSTGPRPEAPTRRSASTREIFGQRTDVVGDLP